MLPAPVPLTSLRFNAPTEGRCLMLLLPGRGDSASDYERHGFVEAARQSKAPVDLIALDATTGYYARRTLLERVRKDVVEPLRAAGDKRPLWLAGISMGGLGALLEARDLGSEVEGVLLLAPFLGDEDLIDEMAGAGGPLQWKPGYAGEDYQRELWTWLQGPLASGRSPLLYLGFGESDWMAKGHRVLAGALPAERVFRRPGVHNWETWLPLWRDFLLRSDFAAHCGGR